MDGLSTKNHGKESFVCSDPHQSGVEGYFVCLNNLKPLFKKTDFQDSTPSFYINYIRNDEIGNPGSVRLNYFTNNGEKTQKIINDFIQETPTVKLLYCEDSRKDPENNGRTAPEEGDNEERWRNFCRAYSYICLDLLYYNVQCSRKLALNYRLNYLSQITFCKSIFEGIFKKHSHFFREQLKDHYFIKEFWEDLGGSWDHFLVNMLLPGEPHEYFPNFFPKSIPLINSYISLTEEQKSYIASSLGLDLSDNWKTNCDF